MCQKSMVDKRYIYIACPWGPSGGGMFRVADYLVQYQREQNISPALRPLDSRGQSLKLSIFVLAVAFGKILLGRLGGNLVGVHVNVAERLSLVRKGGLIVFARLLGLPAILHLHAAQLPACYQGLSKIGKVLTRWMFCKATVCVVLGDRAKRFVIEELGVSPEKVRVLVNGVPLPNISDDVCKKKNVFQILFVGNLTERKGVSDLINALASERFRERSGWKAVFAGGGDVRRYQALVAEKGLADKVDFHGWVGQDVAAKLMATSDVLILPSYDEGLPLVILEALGRGLPVICTPVGEIPEFLTNRQTAVFVEPGDVDGIAEALFFAMNEPGFQAQLAKNGVECYQRMFAISVFFKNTYSIYKEFIPAVVGADSVVSSIKR